MEHAAGFRTALGGIIQQFERSASASIRARSMNFSGRFRGPFGMRIAEAATLANDSTADRFVDPRIAVWHRMQTTSALPGSCRPYSLSTGLADR